MSSTNIEIPWNLGIKDEKLAIRFKEYLIDF
jgi:hypothetical protein